jgi:hypothetical protein
MVGLSFLKESSADNLAFWQHAVDGHLKKKKHALDGDQLCVHQTRHVARGLFLITQYVRLAIKYYSILTN